MDEDATILFLDRFAVRVAGVIDPTRFVPADLRVDDVDAIVDPKKKGVRIVYIGRNTRSRIESNSRLGRRSWEGRRIDDVHDSLQNRDDDSRVNVESLF